MQDITIFSLNNSGDFLKEIIEKSVFSRRIINKTDSNIDIMLNNKRKLNLSFLKEFEESCFAIKHTALINFEKLNTENELMKFQLVNYIKEAKGIITILCKSEFEKETFLAISNICKISSGIIFIDGILINSDSKILLDLKGNSETQDFLGKPSLFPMDFNENLYFESIQNLPIKINENLPSIYDIQEIRIRNKEDLVKRGLVLTLLGSYSDSLKKSNNIELVRNFLFTQIRKYGISGAFSENELNFLFNNKPNDREIEYFSKSYEFANLIFWTLSLIENLTFPPTPVLSHELIMTSSKYFSLDEMIGTSLLKDENVIVGNFDLNYKLLNSAMEIDFLENSIHNSINIELLKQRDKAFKWITTYKNFDWDKI